MRYAFQKIKIRVLFLLCFWDKYEIILRRFMMASNNEKDSRQGGSNRGFASMDEDKQREIASKGGKAAHEKGTAHEFDSEEAREAGRKGGEASHGGRSASSRSSSSSSRGGSSAHH